MSEDTKMKFRASEMENFSDCARRAMAKRREGELIATGVYNEQSFNYHISLPIGTAVHFVAESGRFNPDDVLGKFEEELNLSEKPIMYDTVTPTIEKSREMVLTMAQEFVTNHSEYWWDEEDGNVMIEASLSATIKDSKTGEDVKITGHMDRYSPMRNEIADIKTSAQKRPHGAQYGLYSMLVKKALESPAPPDCREIVIYKKRNTKPKRKIEGWNNDIKLSEVVMYEAKDHISHAKNMLRIGVDSELAMGDDLDFSRVPANPSSMLCSPKFCMLFGTEHCPQSKYKE